MRSSLIRTAIVTSVLTTLVVTGAAMYVGPRLMNPTAPMSDLGIQPAVYQGTDSSYANPPVDTNPQVQPRATAPRRTSRPVYRQAAARDTYGEPVRRGRSTRNSVLIVAGSAGTGAAIGGLAGGGKGAAIGAIAGGVGGLVYDRLTANK
ncbi:MAG: hypothetical protein ACE14L_14750 [Terriglobales bacterium]